MIRVLTVDDHPFMRSGIAAEVNSQVDMEIVGEASDGDDAISLHRALQPDVTLMDIRMPKTDGLEAIVSILRESSHAKIIVLTSVSGDAKARQAVVAGASGYVLKDTLRKDLIEAIRAVHDGRKMFPADIAFQIARRSPQDSLSVRELEVLSRVAEGNSNKLIADNLGITENTVKNHMKNILTKLAASDRTHAVTLALKRGFIDAL